MDNVNLISPLDGFDAALGSALWRLQDARVRTLAAVDGLTDDEVDAIADKLDNTVGATIYHVAAIEADWLYADILRVEFPQWVVDWFPFDVREEDGRLSPVAGFDVENHLARLAIVREHFLKDIKQLDVTMFGESNGLEANPSTPEWIFHHLCQHEAEHRGQIQSLRTALRNR